MKIGKCKMMLIEGEVTFSLRVATLVSEDKAENEHIMKDLLEMLAYEQLSGSGECEIEIDNGVDVTVDKHTAREYDCCFLHDKDWKTIIENSKEM